MRRRCSARVLLFDPLGRILLMKGRLPHAPDAPGEWFTVGGGVQPGETVTQAAVREIFEETGFSDIEVGPELWRREVEAVTVRGEAVLVLETYLAARCAGGSPSRDGWEAHEHALVDDVRWWTLEEIAAAAAEGEAFHPAGLAGYLAEALAAGPTAEPRELPRVTRD